MESNLKGPTLGFHKWKRNSSASLIGEHVSERKIKGQAFWLQDLRGGAHFKDFKREFWLLEKEDSRWTETKGCRRKVGREYSAAAAIRLPWLILFLVLLSIQVCLANFLILRLRMKPYLMK